MATINPKKRTDGGTSYTVRWIIGGGRYAPGKELGAETFTNLKRAERFKIDVELAGHQWPEGWLKGKGYVTDQPSAGPTFADVAEDFFAFQVERVKRNKLKAMTLYRYRRVHALRLSTFDVMPFVDIKHRHVEDWISDIMEDVGAKTVRNYHGVLYSIMRHGSARMDLRRDNPCDVSELPQDDARERRQIRFFRHEEWNHFRSHLDEDVWLLVDVLIMTGMRWGELSALRFGDLDEKPNGDIVITISQAWSKRAPDDNSVIRPDLHENSSWVLGTPKSRKSRKVVVTDEVAEQLRNYSAGKDKGQYVFTRPGERSTGSPWRYPDFHYDRWLPARLKVAADGVTKHFTPHMLRHTTVVWSLAGGVTLEQISERLGHASIQITYDIYGGIVDLEDNAMAKTMSQQTLIKSIKPKRQEEAM